MARPRIIRFPNGGEVVLKNVAPDLADQIKSLAAGGKENAPDTSAEFTRFALGTGQEFPSGQWCVYVIGYDPATSEASIVSKETVGKEKYFADERFKILASEYKLV